MKKYDFYDKFYEIEKEFMNSQKRLAVDSCLKVYYGITADKLLRISFISSIKPLKIESTKELRVFQGKESEGVYWTCFDLIHDTSKELFCVFCDSLVESIDGEKDEYVAINNLKNRFYAWKSLLKNKGKMSRESYQGLFGELLFLVEMARKIGINRAIDSWVGPDGYSKDFSLDDTWYEVKTIGSSSVAIKINSLSQLDSESDGHLVVYRVERMSDAYDEGFSDIPKIYKYVMDMILDNEYKEIFTNKMIKYGYIDEENTINDDKFMLKDFAVYNVKKDFPRLRQKDIKTDAIPNVSYELLLLAIEQYKEEK